MGIGERVKEARISTGMSVQELARKTGIAVTTLYDLERGDQKRSTKLGVIAKVTGFNALWLETGEGRRQPDASNTLRLETSIRTVPVLDMLQAIRPHEVVDNFHTGNNTNVITIDTVLASVLGDHAFAIEVVGESMYNAASPDCVRPGDVVIIDPGQKPTPGDFVVAAMGKSNEATFKKYRSLGDDPQGRPVFELVPLNNDFPTLTVNAANPGYIVGTMIEHRKRRRRE